MTVREIECTLKWSSSRVTRTETEKLGNEGTENSKNWTIEKLKNSKVHHGFHVNTAELRPKAASVSRNNIQKQHAVAIPYATVLFNSADCGLYRKTC